MADYVVQYLQRNVPITRSFVDPFDSKTKEHTSNYDVWIDTTWGNSNMDDEGTTPSTLSDCYTGLYKAEACNPKETYRIVGLVRSKLSH